MNAYFLDNRLHDRFVSKCKNFYTCFFFLVKIITEQIPFVLAEVIKICRKLLLAPPVVLIAVPDFQLHDKLLACVIDNHIGALSIPCLRLDIIIANTIDDGL